MGSTRVDCRANPSRGSWRQFRAVGEDRAADRATVLIKRILADQRRREVVLDDPDRGEPALYRCRLGNAEGAVIAMDSDPGAALRRLVVGHPGDLKSL